MARPVTVRFEELRFRKSYTYHGKTTVQNTKFCKNLEIHISNFERPANWVNESRSDDK